MRDPQWMDGVLRVIATSLDRDFDAPWQTKPSSHTGSAVVIGPGLLLTSADIVANATYVRIQLSASPEQATVRVKAVNHDCDLALLEVIGDADLISEIIPAEVGPMPALWDDVAVVGYPGGSDALSIVRGVVSKIGVQRYTHSQRHLLAITVDAAIGDDHGGGPVFLDGMVVGIVIQKLTDEAAVCEIVPPPIIRAFLDGVEAGKRPQIPALGFTTQNLENPRLREHLGLGEDEAGVAVVHVEHGESADGILERGDVITAIDGIAISNIGIVDYMTLHPVRYDAVLGARHIGDRVSLEIKRAGQPRTVELELGQWMPLVPRARYDQAPRYLVYAGLVFQTLTRDYLTTWDKWWNKAPKEFLNLYYLGHRTAEQHEVVILTQILSDEINVGYTHLHNEAIARIDGVPPLDMADFVTRLSSARGTVKIETTSGGMIVLDVDEARAATERILARDGIPYDRVLTSLN